MVDTSVYGLPVVIWLRRYCSRDRLLQAIRSLNWGLLDIRVVLDYEGGKDMFMFNPCYASVYACMHVVQQGGGSNAVLPNVAGWCLVVCARVALELLTSRLQAQSGCKCSPSDQVQGRALVLVGCVKLASV